MSNVTGLRNSPTYHSWRAMRKRCLAPYHHNYPAYGGRGITVCPEWDSFSQFVADMGIRPEDKTLDRIDVDGPYCPENCRWATDAEQRANKQIHRVAVAA